MAIVTFPLFLLPIAHDAVYGTVLGTSWQLVDSDDARIRTTLARWARRQSEEDLGYYEPEIEDARMQTVTVRVRLAYPGRRGAHPVDRRLALRVAAVYGADEAAGYWKCYLPLLEREFYYYAPDQLHGLIEHFTRERLEGAPPEHAHRFVMRAEPRLEALRVRQPREGAGRHSDRRSPELSSELRRAAEQLPRERRMRRRRVVPEAAWERAGVVEQLSDDLTAAPANLVLVGEDGVGKTTIWLEVIRRVHRATRGGKAPRRFFRTSAQRLIADAKYLGEWEETCERLAAELYAIGGILWVTDPVNLLQIGGDGPESSVAAFLLPLIQAGELHLLGEMTPGEVAAARRLLPGFLECFNLVEVPELDGTQMRRVLERFARHADRGLRIRFGEQALARTHSLLARHLPGERFPGKAMRFLEACVRTARREQWSEVDASRVLSVFTRRTGLPADLLDDARLLEPGAIAAFFTQRIIGQDSATRQLVSVVAAYKAGLHDPERPIATLLLCGPTGVGKTAAARALAEYFFSSGQTRDPLYRIDMSELQHPAQIARLIGASAREPGTLIQHVRDRPFTVLLLDEIEKADESFLDVLLTLLDEGRLRDALGRTTDFRNTIVVMTSNLGTETSGSVGFVHGVETVDREAVRRFFRPEFYNRIDHVIAFQPLGRDAIRAIARIELERIEQREGLARRGIAMRFDDDVVDHVARVGFSPRYGARPLQRAIEQEVVAALSRALLEMGGDLPQALRVRMDGGHVLVEGRGDPRRGTALPLAPN